LEDTDHFLSHYIHFSHKNNPKLPLASVMIVFLLLSDSVENIHFAITFPTITEYNKKYNKYRVKTLWQYSSYTIPTTLSI